MTVKLLFLGELDTHAGIFIPFLSEHGYDVKVVNTSHWAFPQKIEGTDIPVYNMYENSKILLFKGRLGWFRKAAFYSLAEKQKFIGRHVERIIKQEEINIVYGSWGSHGLPELRLARKFNLPIVYEFLTYPTNIYGFTVKIENIFNRSIINSLKGRIFPTQRMLNYMRNTFNIHQGKNIVFTECYPLKFFYKRRLPRLSEYDSRPHLIFIGSDVHDILPDLEEIIQREIYVHVLYSKELEQRLHSVKFKNFVSTFEKFDYSQLLNGEFATFMTQFDACLVTYNFRKASVLDRFYNSIPNRFSFALTAGIPIIMPQGYLKGCEEIIDMNQIGFTYTNYDDLKNKLSNEELMNYYKKMAERNIENFTLEENFEKLDNFLKQTRDDVGDSI